MSTTRSTPERNTASRQKDSRASSRGLLDSFTQQAVLHTCVHATDDSLYLFRAALPGKQKETTEQEKLSGHSFQCELAPIFNPTELLPFSSGKKLETFPEWRQRRCIVKCGICKQNQPGGTTPLLEHLRLQFAASFSVGESHQVSKKAEELVNQIEDALLESPGQQKFPEARARRQRYKSLPGCSQQGRLTTVPMSIRSPISFPNGTGRAYDP